MSPRSFLFFLISLLAYSRCVAQGAVSPYYCHPVKVTRVECEKAIGSIKYFPQDNSVTPGEGRITVTSGGCLVKVISTGAGASFKNDINTVFKLGMDACPRGGTFVAVPFQILVLEAPRDDLLLGPKAPLPGKIFCTKEKYYVPADCLQ
ncbi:hypothetical protein PTTG_27027 [Puccinia triticina 1-1 BBBD Race 1]|uniref:Phosphatidylglycerol/phosphatidylinositol transfer protein n=1 Tax=Puccinia triticina (isolate 1-1 / race 1 (BBBD)) TaxID=630390 RepID=A0A180GPP3_PUCT1|nr:hypothetical protein PTTG_27027 [Puccinia triticina 1-1 BBBD Race 1]WAR62283.1 hypothetical protein PtB15_14B378 [Puccinia triticina]